MRLDRLQWQRFELKYIIPEQITQGIREFVRPYLDLDAYGAKHPDHSYPIHSVYLDSDGFALYWDSLTGASNRYKLRLRFYDDRPDSPVYFEIKRRINDAILKERAAVHRRAIEHLLAGEAPRPEDLAEGADQFPSLQRFSDRIIHLRARPRTRVAYLREAWVSPVDNSVRVTFDRQIRTQPEPIVRLLKQLDNPVDVFSSQVVLELKFSGRFPNWLREMVRVFDLERCSAPKYVEGVTLLGEQRLGPALVAKLPNPRPASAPALASWPHLLEEPA